MPGPKPPRKQKPVEGARGTAFNTLNDWEADYGALEMLRDRAFARGRLSGRDRALVTELTQGVVRHLLLLDRRIDSLLDRPGKPLPPPVRMALRMGVYQILFLHKIPMHAAVGETVQLLKQTACQRYVPLCNALLRKAADADAPPLPSPKARPADYLSISNSMPLWFVTRILERHGFTEARDLFQAMNRPAPLTLRVNSLRTDRPSLLSVLKDMGIAARPGRLSPLAVILEEGGSPALLPPFERGLCTVQDEGAQVIAPLLGVLPGLTVVDACAAPGGKAGHLAQIMDDRGLILALDSSPLRTAMMEQTLRRMGLSSVRPVVGDTRRLSALLRRSPSAILLDAPCSGTGVLRRHPEGKWRKDPEGVWGLASLQRTMLDEAGRALAPGGRLLYTTCSVLEEENEEVVDGHLAASPFRMEDLRDGDHGLPADAFTPRGELRLWPHRHDCDGFYAALMIKKES